MKVNQFSKRVVVAISSTASASDAAKLMRDERVGLLVVYRGADELRRPVGVLTDRDIVLQVTTRDVAAAAVQVEDVMTPYPLIANETDDVSETLQAMRLAGIRRAPVVDGLGALTGIIAIDDAVDVVTSLMCDISGSIRSVQPAELRRRTS